MPTKAIIIGAGPAGLTAAYELLQHTDIIPIVLEKSGDIGGISKTVNYKGNRMDIGGHRFFSKSDRVMQWWLNIMPVQPMEEQQFTVTYQRHSRTIKKMETCGRQENTSDLVMLVRNRLSRIYFLRKFFSYPIQLSLDTLRKLGLARTLGILVSYSKARLFPRKPEKSLEDFFINRFGEKLYRLFFKDYTEKVWGVPCTKISSEWGAQRIKGISIAKAIAHAVKSFKPKPKVGKNDISQKGTETSLIERFLYPKFGPGQLWEEVARQVQEKGGQVIFHQDVRAIEMDGEQVTAVTTLDAQTGQSRIWEGDYFFSTMPVKELIAAMGKEVPANVQETASGLQYRDFITVGMLLRKMVPPKGDAADAPSGILPDTWIYIQEKDVRVGRLQLFNNWSPFMVKDPNTVWIGMEYFCNTTDAFWQLSDEEIKVQAVSELAKMGLADSVDVLDTNVLRVEKTYPAYFGTYERFEEVKQFTDRFANLFLVGRNGMHKYNNSDHSMLTAMVSVDNIRKGISTKDNIWSINTEQEYHEEKVQEKTEVPARAAASVAVPGQREGFKDYLFKDRRNKPFLWTAGIAIILQFAIFKHFYPLAGFISGDSYVYLETAYGNFDINTYPTGYSKFLRIFSVFSNSDFALVAFQYLMFQASSLFFLFTCFYFYRPGRMVRWLLFVFVVFNPVFLYLGNYVLSDALFIPLSISWFTLLLWILHRPTTRLLIVQAIILFLAFTVRYNALFYPLVGAIALLLSRQRIWIKLAAISGSFLLIGSFVLFISSRYKEFVGIWEFTPFSGWQIANNAMYAYRYVDHDKLVIPPPHFRELDRMVRTYFDSTRDTKKHPESMLVASTVYMWDPSSPLQKYMDLQFKTDSIAKPLKRWATVAPLYAEYGKWLVRTYPLEYAAHYLLPNALKYYTPPVEFLETYNMGIDSVAGIAQMWFHWKSPKVKTLMKDFNVSTLNWFPIVIGVLNVLFLLSTLFYGILNGIKNDNRLGQILWLTIGLWIVNFGFSVYASPIALRFQLFPVLIYITVACLLLESIWKAAFSSAINTSVL
ncbi:MAG TPA: NAD(P)/FAD-dependent oxidoreductase [Puia sp.]|uniref:NAD(P)/FAD-dependent oxidoreductase n=1 Tax=Puia sp. TaxID=2045100 RepID=UPI002C097CF7|nr:NAD(P)/FAD-dependent oxidoreductase [Puia sp.]HVU95510.1 NAD(P)/FAD-dependent oxidoreductase [Puia sp.]